MSHRRGRKVEEGSKDTEYGDHYVTTETVTSKYHQIELSKAQLLSLIREKYPKMVVDDEDVTIYEVEGELTVSWTESGTAEQSRKIGKW